MPALKAIVFAYRAHACPQRFALAVVFCVAAILPGRAEANAGVPMLALAWPLQWMALVPIALVECEVGRRVLRRPFRTLIWPVAKANLASTLIGIPLAWIAMLALEFVVAMAMAALPEQVQALPTLRYVLFPFMVAWVGDAKWQVYSAFIVLAVPFCAVSIAIERWVLAKALPDIVGSDLRSFVLRANVSSYALLVASSILFPLTA